jgi:hypothetical protein
MKIIHFLTILVAISFPELLYAVGANDIESPIIMADFEHMKGVTVERHQHHNSGARIEDRTMIEDQKKEITSFTISFALPVNKTLRQLFQDTKRGDSGDTVYLVVKDADGNLLLSSILYQIPQHRDPDVSMANFSFSIATELLEYSYLRFHWRGVRNDLVKSVYFSPNALKK